ncbi:hypothetical protein JCM1840_002367 [Sporobolomyces johnsonii]
MMNEQFDRSRIEKYIKCGITDEGDILLAYKSPGNGWTQVVAGTQGHENGFKPLENFVTLVTRGKHSRWQDLPNPPPTKYNYFQKKMWHDPADTTCRVAPDTRAPPLDLSGILM